MKVIYLDIDGVLNYRYCAETFKGFVGICDENLLLLKKIVDATKAKIVLTSTWRHDVKERSDLGNYLLEKFQKVGLEVYDCVTYSGHHRGFGIVSWNDAHNVDEWVVLDDEIFPDYPELGIMEHLVKTSYYEKGLESKHVWEAIAKLNGSILDGMLNSMQED